MFSGMSLPAVSTDDQMSLKVGSRPLTSRFKNIRLFFLGQPVKAYVHMMVDGGGSSAVQTPSGAGADRNCFLVCQLVRESFP